MAAKEQNKKMILRFLLRWFGYFIKI